ncbi:MULTISPECIES: ABC transporter ATP-binding protein [unclassified Clostridium]|uniref:ABC transporter ATP-binding protein n=1 Tax=unclassified Clostridium TaxID=2614128 RepID=UPI000297CF3C|nr:MULTISPECIES: ABC transporter ATP-binding protein [unclassified Clostridium]EKQ56927.1 MAG: ABC-type multidrug transport system, ATPase and permease component [Clostridium sp. Maddingley MBC34-26]
MNRNSILLRLLAYIKPYKIYLLGAILSAILSISLTLYCPILIGNAIDLILGPENVHYSKISTILFTFTAAIAISAFFQWILSILTTNITQKTVKDLRVDAFNKLNTLPLKYIDSNAHGDIISKIVNDVDAVSDGLLQGLTQLFTGIITIVLTLVFMLSISPIITFVVMFVTPLSLFIASFIAKHSNKMFKEQSSVQGELSGHIEEMLGNQKVINAFNHEKASINKFKEINSRLYSCGSKAQFYSSLSNPATRFVNGLVYAAVGVIGTIYCILGYISIGNISCFLTYANQYTKPFNEVTSVLSQLQSAFSSAKRLFNLLDEKSESADLENSITTTSCKGNIIFSKVCFSYDKSKKLIENFNLSVKSGYKVAIVGPTGSGKTTLVNLLMRFYDVDSGNIKIDGIEINDFSKATLRNLFGMVLQETWLSEGTIRDNISYGKNDASDEEIINAAKKAKVHNFIMKLHNGYDTLISEGGANLSAGQKQLLCIARVILIDPPMLILDEATSNIDTRTEANIQEAFNQVMIGRTSFIIAHRLSTIKQADIILVLKDGQIIEQGKHEQLLEENGFYSNLYNSQFAIS